MSISRIICAPACLIAMLGPAIGQTSAGLTSGFSAPVVGSSWGGKPTDYRPPNPLSSTNQTDRIHKDVAGKPCLSVGGFARAYATNDKLFDHVVVSNNRCPVKIITQICYRNSKSCITVEVPAYQRKDSILGIQPGAKDFQFEYREKT